MIKDPKGVSFSNIKRHAGRALKLYKGGQLPQDEDLYAIKDMYEEEEPDMELQKYSMGGEVGDEYEDIDYKDDMFEKQNEIYYHDEANPNAPFPKKMAKGGMLAFANAVKMKRGY